MRSFVVLITIDIHQTRNVEIDLPIEVGADLPQAKLMHIRASGTAHLFHELGNVTDPLRSDAFRKTVTKKNPVSNHSPIQTSTAQ